MSAPPVFDEDAFVRGLAQIQEALEHAPEAARAETKQVLDSDELVKRVVNIVEPVMDSRFRRKYYRNLIFGVGILLLIFAIAILAAFQQISSVAAANAATNTDQDAALQRTQATIDAFQDQLDAANAQLIAQGLPPVIGPPDPTPGSPEQAQLINAAATASTLATLPRTALANPSPGDLAAAVADYLRTNPPGVDPNVVIDAVAAYFAANQAELRGPAGAPGQDGAPGEPGPVGPQGPPPTAEQIQAAFRDEVQANPQLLCPLGGDYGGRQVALADGGSVTQFGCFGAETGPPDDGGGGGGGEDPGDEQEAPGNSGGGDAAVPPPVTDGGRTNDPEPQPEQTATQAPEPPVVAPTTSPAPQPTPEPAPDLLEDLLGVGDDLLGAG